MSSTPPAAPEPDQQAGPPIPPGYKPGDYVPFADRDPSNPSSIAGQWADPARQAQMHGQQAGRALTPQEQYRAIYGYDAPERIEFASWGRRVLGYLVDAFLGAVASIPLFVGYAMGVQRERLRTDNNGDPVVADTIQRRAAPRVGDARRSAASSAWPSSSTTRSSGRAAPVTASARPRWGSGS